MSGPKLTGAVVGCRGMGRWHAKALHLATACNLTAICDLNEALAQEVAAEYPGVRAYADLDRMLATEQPDIIAIATPNTSHAALTLRCAAAGVRGICCEKPMAICLADAKAMTAGCRERGIPLIIHHQRRMLGSLVRMRELIVEGAIGEVQLLRGSCQGDLLTDGTHVLDSLLHLAGDADAERVFGGIFRLPPPPDEAPSMGFQAAGGYRYGHPVESGAFGIVEFRNGLRAEVLCGKLHPAGRQYQDYEVLGTRGRLWRTGDRDQPGVLIQTAGSSDWRPIDAPSDDHEQLMARVYDRFAAGIRAGTAHEHPLCADRALRGFEILMAIYEAARRHAQIELPLRQERFPLALLLEDLAGGAPSGTMETP